MGLLWPLPNMAALKGFPPSAAAELVCAARNLVRSSTSVKRAKVLSAGDNPFVAKGGFGRRLFAVWFCVAMDALTLFGLFAVTLMLVCYARRS